MNNLQSNTKRLNNLEKKLMPERRDQVFLFNEISGLVRVGNREIPYDTFKKIYPGPLILLHTGAFTRRIETWEYEREIMRREEGREFDQEFIDNYEKKYLGGK